MSFLFANVRSGAYVECHLHSGKHPVRFWVVYRELEVFSSGRLSSYSFSWDRRTQFQSSPSNEAVLSAKGVAVGGWGTNYKGFRGIFYLYIYIYIYIYIYNIFKKKEGMTSLGILLILAWENDEIEMVDFVWWCSFSNDLLYFMFLLSLLFLLFHFRFLFYFIYFNLSLIPTLYTVRIIIKFKP
jgi:hypothetical protein